MAYCNERGAETPENRARPRQDVLRICIGALLIVEALGACHPGTTATSDRPSPTRPLGDSCEWMRTALSDSIKAFRHAVELGRLRPDITPVPSREAALAYREVSEDLARAGSALSTEAGQIEGQFLSAAQSLVDGNPDLALNLFYDAVSNGVRLKSQIASRYASAAECTSPAAGSPSAPTPGPTSFASSGEGSPNPSWSPSLPASPGQPQAVAMELVTAWKRGDRQAATQLASAQAVDAMFQYLSTDTPYHIQLDEPCSPDLLMSNGTELHGFTCHFEYWQLDGSVDLSVDMFLVGGEGGSGYTVFRVAVAGSD